MNDVKRITKLIRYWSLVSTSKAGSGHPTSSMSAADLMTVLLFGDFFRFKVKKPDYHSNDRLIFSKGHASPLFYALWTSAGAITEKKLMTLRDFKSQLEGHPTMRFKYTEAATGSLGQGMSVGVGMALSAQYIERLPYRTFVLLGDSEMAEGSVWEAIQLAAHYKLNNLIGILDVNRLGQRGETMYGHDMKAYEKRIGAFGWQTLLVDGHNLKKIAQAYEKALKVKDRPVMIIAKTLKGKGVSFLEDAEGWHGKSLDADQLKKALKELGPVDTLLRGSVAEPPERVMKITKSKAAKKIKLKLGQMIATRQAYGDALKRIAPRFPEIVALDGEVSNSTHSDVFKKSNKRRFFEMYIAEQNMIGAALGMSRRGLKPFVSSFAAFFTRAFDQIRMAQYSDPNVTLVGSHAGVSIGADGPSQMGLEDIAMMRAVHRSVVLYPSDGVATHKLVEQAAKNRGLIYIRTTRSKTPVLYSTGANFPVGGSKVLKKSKSDVVTIVSAGITLHEALKAYELLSKKGVAIRIIDLYSIKPIDLQTLRTAARETGTIIVVEDHYPEGGLGEAVRSALGNTSCRFEHLAVRKMPRSGTEQELLDFEGISAQAIIKKIHQLQKTSRRRS